MVTNLLAQFSSAKPVRGNVAGVLPIDMDSRMELVSNEWVVMDKEPTWPTAVNELLLSIVQERVHMDNLLQRGIEPTKSALFVGPPGVGKTLAARWLSFKLGRPLVTMDLASVMSSYLGRTGNNIRAVIQYGQETPSVLLLDEFDAVAKRRGDDSEVGELKRLVTVLLQTIDRWPATGLLLAATNHPDLLDPAIWRRFDRIIEFPVPSREVIEPFIKGLFDADDTINSWGEWISILAIALGGSSFSDISRFVNNARRESVINERPILEVLESDVHIWSALKIDCFGTVVCECSVYSTNSAIFGPFNPFFSATTPRVVATLESKRSHRDPGWNLGDVAVAPPKRERQSGWNLTDSGPRCLL